MSQMAVYSVDPCQLPRERFTPTELHNGALAQFLDSSNVACAKFEFAGVVYMCCEQRSRHLIRSAAHLGTYFALWANYITHTRECGISCASASELRLRGHS